MNRRRMMMLQAQDDSGIEIPEEYKRSFSTYALQAVWNDNTVTINHTEMSFLGPSQAYLLLIGKQDKSAQNVRGAFLPDAYNSLNGFSNTKCYKLTLKVVKVNNSTASDSTEDMFTIAIGRREKYYTTSIGIKDIKVGTVIEVEMSSATLFEGIVFGSTVGSALWSFDFKYRLEEV